MNVRLHLTLYLQVTLYGIGLATYAWRYASKPKQLLADEETAGVQPTLLGEPVTEPLDPSKNSSTTRHSSELMSSLPSASVRDSCRESARKSRLEGRSLF